MNQVRLGVIGLGNMGSAHIPLIRNIPEIKLTAVCDTCRDKADKTAAENNVSAFYDHHGLIKSGLADAVLVATPHYSHTPIAIDSFNAGLHVLTEKPIAAHISDAEKMISTHKRHPELKWGAMFQMRTAGVYKKIKEILNSGEYGRIIRINYIITNWFRTQAYYDSGTWRATWSGEGGGLLLNQCPHQLDLFQWFFGMPDEVMADCGIGKFHDIEVEDDVTACLKFKDGMTASFVSSTGDAPGSSRLEITAEKGRILLEEERLIITRNDCSSQDFIRTSMEGFSRPGASTFEVMVEKDPDSLHRIVTRNFAEAIRHGTPLIANGEEGLNSLMLANSMLYSSLTGKKLRLPLNPARYRKKLMSLISGSVFSKKTGTGLEGSDFSGSFNK